MAKDDTPGPAAKVQLYEQAVLEYERLSKEIVSVLSSKDGHADKLSDEEFAHYRELADLRDLAYNKVKTLERGLLDDI
jgi:hypothetical protein